MVWISSLWLTIIVVIVVEHLYSATQRFRITKKYDVPKQRKWKAAVPVEDVSSYGGAQISKASSLSSSTLHGGMTRRQRVEWPGSEEAEVHKVWMYKGVDPTSVLCISVRIWTGCAESQEASVECISCQGLEKRDTWMELPKSTLVQSSAWTRFLSAWGWSKCQMVQSWCRWWRDVWEIWLR